MVTYDGKNLKARRESLRLRQIEVAQRAGVDNALLSKIENGWVNPRPQIYIKILRVLESFERKE